MRNRITFNPQQLTTPQAVKAFQRFTEVKNSVESAIDTVRKQDNVKGVDSNDNVGTVSVDEFRVKGETFTGQVEPSSAELASRKVEEYVDTYARVESNYQKSGDNFTLSRKTESETSYGRYRGVERDSWKTESFQTNANGTITYRLNSNSRSRGVGER